MRLNDAWFRYQRTIFYVNGTERLFSSRESKLCLSVSSVIRVATELCQLQKNTKTRFLILLLHWSCRGNLKFFVLLVVEPTAWRFKLFKIHFFIGPVGASPFFRLKKENEPFPKLFTARLGTSWTNQVMINEGDCFNSGCTATSEQTTPQYYCLIYFPSHDRNELGWLRLQTRRIVSGSARSLKNQALSEAWKKNMQARRSLCS